MKMRTCGASLVLWWVAMGMAWPAPGPARAPAAGGKREEARARTVVMMAARGQASAAQELHRAVGAQLSDVPVKLALHWVESLGKDLRAELLQARRLAKEPGVAVVFWCDLEGSDDVYLFLAEPGGGRLLVRAVPQGARSARAESMAIIVGASVRAFLLAGPRPARAGGAVGPGPAAGPAAGPVVRPAAQPGLRSGRGPAAQGARASAPGGASPSGPTHSVARSSAVGPDAVMLRSGRARARRPPFLSLELGYAADTYNRENAPLHGARLAVTWRLSRLVSVFASYRVLQAINGRLEVAEVGLQRNPIALGGILHFRVGRFRLGGLTALVVDYVATEARTALGSGAVMDRSSSKGDWHLLAAAGLVGGIEVVERLWLEIGIGAEFVFYSKGYYVRIPEETGFREETILRPWWAQPYGVLGLRLEIL